MDMKINFLPAKTWNWLRMNETEVKQVKADRQALEKEEIPETFAVEASTLEPIKTGMGPDMDKLAEQSGFAAKAYRMPAGIKEAAALRLGFVCKDQTASLDLIDLIAEENSEMTVVMDYASDADAEGLCSVRTRAKVGKGALLRLVQIDCLGKGFRVLMMSEASARIRDALKWCTFSWAAERFIRDARQSFSEMKAPCSPISVICYRTISVWT